MSENAKNIFFVDEAMVKRPREAKKANDRKPKTITIQQICAVIKEVEGSLEKFIKQQCSKHFADDKVDPAIPLYGSNAHLMLGFVVLAAKNLQGQRCFNESLGRFVPRPGYQTIKDMMKNAGCFPFEEPDEVDGEGEEDEEEEEATEQNDDEVPIAMMADNAGSV